MQLLERKRSLGCIEVLRVIAALGVMLSHVGYGFYYTNGFRASIGVNLFFCISSFLMMYNSERTDSKTLFIRRIIRLVPLYWLLTVLTFAASYVITDFGQEQLPVEQLLKSLFFIPYMRDGLKSSGIVRPIVGPAWTMNYDFWFLVIFVICTRISRKHRGLIVCLVCLALRISSGFFPEGQATSLFLGRTVWLCYIAGICVYKLWFLLRNKGDGWKPIPALYLGICALLLALLYFTPLPVWATVLLCAAILFTVLFAFEKAPIPRVISWFGKLSYSFYLTHYYVVMILSYIFDFTKLSVYTVLGTLCVLVISVLISQMSFFVLERKLGNFLRNGLLR